MSDPQFRLRVVSKQSVERVEQVTVNTVGLAWVPDGIEAPTGPGQPTFYIELSSTDYDALELGDTYDCTIHTTAPEA